MTGFTLAHFLIGIAAGLLLGFALVWAAFILRDWARR